MVLNYKYIYSIDYNQILVGFILKLILKTRTGKVIHTHSISTYFNYFHSLPVRILFCKLFKQAILDLRYINNAK